MRKVFFLTTLLLLSFDLKVSGQKDSVSYQIDGKSPIVLRKIAELKKQQGLVYRKGCSPNCYAIDNFVAYPFRGGVQIWDTNNGTSTILSSKNKEIYAALEFSRNAGFVVACGHGDILVWEKSSGNIVSRLPDKSVLNQISISSDGQSLFFYQPKPFFSISYFGNYWLFSPLKSGSKFDLPPEVDRNTRHPDVLAGGNGKFSPVDPNVLAVNYRFRIYLWDISKKAIIRKFIDKTFADGIDIDNEYAHGNDDFLGFNNDGSLLFSQGGGHIRIWDVATGKLLQDLRIEHKAWGVTKFSDDSKYLATANSYGLVSVWDVSSGNMVWSWGKNNYRPNFSNPEVGLVSVESGDVFDFKTGKKVEGLKGEFLPDGKLLQENKDGSFSTWSVERKD